MAVMWPERIFHQMRTIGDGEVVHFVQRLHCKDGKVESFLNIGSTSHKGERSFYFNAENII